MWFSLGVSSMKADVDNFLNFCIGKSIKVFWKWFGASIKCGCFGSPAVQNRLNEFAPIADGEIEFTNLKRIEKGQA